MPQLLRPERLEPVLHNGRGHDNEKPALHSKQWPLLSATRENPVRSNEDPVKQKIKLKNKLKNKTRYHYISIYENGQDPKKKRPSAGKHMEQQDALSQILEGMPKGTATLEVQPLHSLVFTQRS